ncbi:MAG: hypothetical protein AAGF11_48785 [Myxococcota bacterium]
MLNIIRSLTVAVLACAALAGCDPAGDDVVGPEGGTIISRDGRLILEIPQGALAEAIELRIEEVEQLPEGALGPAYQVLPVGTVFEAPVHVLYDYGAEGMDLSPDQVALVAQKTDRWSMLADRTIYEQDSLVSASSLYLSAFCIVDKE